MCYYCLLCATTYLLCGIGIEWVELGRECHLEFLHNSSLLSCPSPWFRVNSTLSVTTMTPNLKYFMQIHSGVVGNVHRVHVPFGKVCCTWIVGSLNIIFTSLECDDQINKLLSRRIFRFGFDQKCSPFSSQYIWLGMGFLLGQPENTTVGELLLLLEERWEGPRQSWAMLPSNPNCFHNFKEAASNASIVFHFLSSPLACFHQM